jgi:hypothetical protein
MPGIPDKEWLAHVKFREKVIDKALVITRK